MPPTPGHRVLYHATDARLTPGDLLIPAAERGHTGRWHRKRVAGYSPHLVYLYAAAADTDFAHNLMHHHGRFHYQVEPVGDLQPDPDPTAGNIAAFTCARARIVREMEW